MLAKSWIRPPKRIAACLLLAFLLPVTGGAQRRDRPRGGEPGVFDFYLLSLSWSPEYCAGPGGARDVIQCGPTRRFAFVVHGLWPQYERGFPESCGPSSPLGQDLVRRMLPLMPSTRLIQHEWDTHGTCSGLPPVRYFETIERAASIVRIPEEYRQPLRQVEVRPAEIKGKFAAANPSIGPQGIRVLCRGQYLSEVRVCLTKDLRGRGCPSGVRDSCREETVIMRPLR